MQAMRYVNVARNENKKRGIVKPGGMFLAKNYFITAGVGDSKYELVAFDKALIEAGVADVNLIKLSSIVPPRCIRIEPTSLQPGSMIGVAFARMVSEIPGQVISSGVAIAHPRDKSRASLVMEHSGNYSRKAVEKIVIDMANLGLKSRNLKTDHIESIAVEHTVQSIGVTFAAVVEV